MTDLYRQVMRQEGRANGVPCHSLRERRKSKLKMRFKGRYDQELERAQEKVDLIREIINERSR